MNMEISIHPLAANGHYAGATAPLLSIDIVPQHN